MGLALVVTALAWTRLTPTTSGTLWAEDGRIFLQDAVHAAPGTTWLQGYDGYLHLVPRVVADLVSLLPAATWAVAMSAASCLIVGVGAGLVLVLTADVTSSVAARYALALLAVLVPTLPVEVLGNVANGHWFGLWALLWLLLYRPRTWAGAVGLAALTLVIALTDVQVVLLAPLALWRWREPKNLAIRLALLAGVAAQAVTLALTPRHPSGSFPGLRNVVEGYVGDVVMPWFVGTSSGTGDAASATLTTLGATAAVLVVPFVIASVLLWRAGGRLRRVLAVALPAGSLLVWIVAIAINGVPAVLVEPDGTEVVLLRYTVMASLLLAAPLVLAAGSRLPRGRAARVVAAAVAVPLVVAVVLSWRPVATTRAPGPLWAPQVADAAVRCDEQATREQVLLLAPPGWTITVPCSLLATP
ncbi:hypothetical protein OEB99_07610 [Actinotalea sp. M2MS4P-6]|uniref:hypothetical protein n=1 Tax=Actinotalea sp. M2MS4P-6 TaxID=2983762 RepID=UPI0021E4B95B|nr:hypothetical protein [Actinotalea sp. M2MS4P-6]MCV2394169.1 hypothetical protein [Actinotalea sp. M2MS4P-6]